MEMLDINHAIELIEGQSMMLKGVRSSVEHYLGQNFKDPEVAKAVVSLQGALVKLYRDSVIGSIALTKLMQNQVPLLLNYPAECGKLMSAQARQSVEFTQTLAVLDRIEKLKATQPAMEKTDGIASAE